MTPPNKGKTYPPEVLTPADVAAIIGGCPAKAPTGIRNRALLTLLYRSGLRVSEALALRPGDVNLAAHTVRVLHGKGGKATTRAASTRPRPTLWPAGPTPAGPSASAAAPCSAPCGAAR